MHKYRIIGFLGAWAFLSTSAFSGNWYTSFDLGVAKINSALLERARSTVRPTMEVLARNGPRFCGYVYLGYDWNLGLYFKLGGFIGYGVGGGHSKVCIKKNTHPNVYAELVHSVQTLRCVPIGLRLGFCMTPNSTLFFSLGSALFYQKVDAHVKQTELYVWIEDWVQYRLHIEKQDSRTRKETVERGFVGLSFESILGKNVFWDMRIDLYIGSLYKDRHPILDAEKKHHFAQTNFMMGLTYRF